MKVLGIKLFGGRNIYNHKPVAKITIDLGKYSNIPTKDIKGFNKRLIESFPNLKQHTCCMGYQGGFLERLERGTYLAHVLEHVLIDIQNTFGYNVKYGKTLEDKNNYDISDVFLEYENAEFITCCSKKGADILNAFIQDRYIDLKDVFYKLDEVKYKTDLGLSTKAIVSEAKKRGIPYTRVNDRNLIRLNYGNKARLIQATLLDCTSCIAVDIASDKNLTKTILNNLQIPVPDGYVVSSASHAYERALDLNAPVVIKPLNTNQGKGVRTNLYNEKEILSSFDIASKYSRKIIVERYIEGKDYRVLVVGDKVAAVALRLPAMVVGDGNSTVKELITKLNSDVNRGKGHEKPLTKVTINDKTYEVLRKQGLSLFDIPSENQKVMLCENCNLSTGGTSEDCTDIIHEHNARFAVESAKALGIHVAGIDFVANDISKCIKETNGAIIEVNAAPGIRMHLHPSVGKARNVAKDIVDFLFDKSQCNNFPIISVTGTNGKTTTVRLISYVLQLTGKSVGKTTTSGTFINKDCISIGDNAGPKSASNLLCQKIDYAVLETARGGIVKNGLGYDMADVAVITNVAEDHLGQNNIHTLDELANVKSLVVEAIKPSGYAILNAEDQSTKSIKDKVYENIIYFYMHKDNVKVEIHNNICITVIDNNIVIKDGGQKITVINVVDIPITLKGVIDCNIYNCLAAVGALYALKIPIEIISQGLQSFKQNNGRFELFECSDYSVMLDYAHNYDGIKQLLESCKKLKHNRLVGVVGMPNNRLEDDYKKVCLLFAKYLDFIYIKEDKYKAGRKEGETMDIFLKTLLDNSFPKDKIVLINNEVEALKTAILNRKKDDLIVTLYEELAPLKKVIKEKDNILLTNKNKTED